MNNVKPTVLAVDDTPINLDILKGILLPDYKLQMANSGEVALKIIEKNQPDIILLDIMMPGIDGYEVCKRLKSDPKTAHIPIIFITAMDNESDEQYGFSLGAVDYIAKPVSAPIVKARVATQLRLANQYKATRAEVDQKTEQLRKIQESAIFMLGEAGHYNDTDTGVHIWRMAAYSQALAKAALWPVPEAELLKLAAPMHDTGKIGIPDEILKAPRKLTEEEFEVMKTHSAIGHKILSKSDSPLFKMAAEISLCHHEKWDGSGYPSQLSGDRIPESARIVAICDVFDALTMKRPYKAPWTTEDALVFIEEQSGSHFDPRLVDLFIKIKSEVIDIREAWKD